MAEQHDNRTKQASARRKEDARRRGQVAVSRDVPSAAMLFGAGGAPLPLVGNRDRSARECNA